MASAVNRELDELKSADRRDRPRLAERLFDQGILATNGSTLFRYHAASLTYTSYTDKCLAMGQAEFDAGVVWASLSTQQRDYWVRQTENLLAGSIAPLDTETSQDFDANRISLLGGDWAADDEDKSSACQLPTPKSLNPFADASTPLAPDSVAGSDTVDEFWDAPLESDTHAAADPESIEDYRDLISELLPGQLHADHSRHLFSKLAESFAVDGQTLFLFHAAVWADQDVAEYHGLNDLAVLMVTVWHAMSHEDKLWWVKRTRTLSELLGRHDRKSVNHLERDVAVHGSRAYAKKALKALGLELEAPADLPRDGSVVKTPVLDYLLGESAANIDPQTVINKVLEVIKAMLSSDQELHLQGRHNGVRISYSPSVKGVTGIANRLCLALRMDNDDFGFYPVSPVAQSSDLVIRRFEQLLRPMVAWNMSRFPKFAGLKKGSMNSTTGWGYRSGWNPLRPQLAKLKPILHAKRYKVVDLLMNTIRKQAELTIRDRDLLAPYEAPDQANSSPSTQTAQKLRQWSLADNEHGFARKLLDVFDRDDLRPEEYEDTLEQKLFSLWHFATGIFSARACT
ncbi:hypothetical protein LTR08_006712 [Meristemomyces frigidus]|nr:hypothetical protein LTR08_006712 [Meristemomyces frigidus]